MKNKTTLRLAFITPRISLALFLVLAGVFLGVIGFGFFAAAEEQPDPAQSQNSTVQFGTSYHNDISPALRDLAVLWPPEENHEREAREAALNPKIPNDHIDSQDPIVQNSAYLRDLLPSIPGTTLNFDGIPFPGVSCNCSPPDTNGAVGATQYVQMVNEGYQVFNKSTGASQLGPSGIATLC